MLMVMVEVTFIVMVMVKVMLKSMVRVMIIVGHGDSPVLTNIYILRTVNQIPLSIPFILCYCYSYSENYTRFGMTESTDSDNDTSFG